MENKRKIQERLEERRNRLKAKAGKSIFNKVMAPSGLDTNSSSPLETKKALEQLIASGNFRGVLSAGSSKPRIKMQQKIALKMDHPKLERALEQLNQYKNSGHENPKFLKEAFRLAEEACHDGSKTAHYFLAADLSEFFQFLGLEEGENEFYSRHIRAAAEGENGLYPAKLQVAKLIINKDSRIHGEPEEAFKLLCEIQNVLSEAQLLLAKCYEEGLGTRKDIKKALGILESLYTQKYVEAYYPLAKIYINGGGSEDGGVLDIDNGMKILKEGSALENVMCCFSFAERSLFDFRLEENYQYSIKLLLQLLESEEANDITKNYARFFLAICYWHGMGVKVDHKKMFELFSQLVQEYKDFSYEIELGRCYKEGYGHSKNPRLAFQAFERGYREINPERRTYFEAKILYARCFLEETGTTLNIENAIKLLLEVEEDARKKSYDLELREAQYLLGLAYKQKEDHKRAVEYFTLASRDPFLPDPQPLRIQPLVGYLQAKYELANCYLLRTGVDLSHDECDRTAFTLLQELDNSGYRTPRVMIDLITCYYDGRGVEKDRKRAQELVMDFVKLKNSKIGEELFKIYKERRQEEGLNADSLFWLKAAAESGYQEAYLLYGVHLALGLGLEANPEQAFTFFKKITEEKLLAEAINATAVCYLYGLGIKQNGNQAVTLLQKAKDLIKKQPQSLKPEILATINNNLGWCYMLGLGVKQNDEKAKELLKEAMEGGSKDAIMNFAFCVLKSTSSTLEQWQDAETLLNSRRENKERLEDSFIKFGVRFGLEGKLPLAIEDSLRDPRDINIIGYCYLKGIGVSQDIQKAFAMFRGAANKGCIYAKHNLTWALLIYAKEGAELKEGLSLLEAEKDKGSELATAIVGFAAMEGFYMPKNYDKGKELLFKVSDDEYRLRHQHELKTEQEKNVEQDFCVRFRLGPNISFEVFGKDLTHMQDKTPILAGIGFCYFHCLNGMREREKAADYFKAIGLKNPYTYFYLSHRYLDGLGVAVDPKQYFECLTQIVNHFEPKVSAEKAGDPLREPVLWGYPKHDRKALIEADLLDVLSQQGECYLEGNGVEQDIQKGLEILNETKKLGCPLAYDILKKFAKRH